MCNELEERLEKQKERFDYLYCDLCEKIICRVWDFDLEESYFICRECSKRKGMPIPDDELLGI